MSLNHPPSLICNVASCLESRKMFLRRAVIRWKRKRALATGSFQRCASGGPIDADRGGARRALADALSSEGVRRAK